MYIRTHWLQPRGVSENIIYHGIIGGLYGNMNTSNDILKELNLRYEETKRFIDITVAFYYVTLDIDV